MARTNDGTKKRRTEPPPGPRKQLGWIPQHATFRDTPIQPDLDSESTGDLLFRAHHTDPQLRVIHDVEGQAKGTIETANLSFLHASFDKDTATAPFPDMVLQQVITQGRAASTIAEAPLRHAPDEENP